MPISPNELAEIVASVFEIMMKLEVSRCQTPWFASDRATSAVHMTGEWNGALLLECDRSLACLFAGRFLSMNPPNTVDEVVRDVLGELANMIAGNMKSAMQSAMPPGISLSLPSVMVGEDPFPCINGAELLERLAFQCGEGWFWVSVLATTGPVCTPASC